MRPVGVPRAIGIALTVVATVYGVGALVAFFSRGRMTLPGIGDVETREADGQLTTELSVNIWVPLAMFVALALLIWAASRALTRGRHGE